jgi:hypothetical protein
MRLYGLADYTVNEVLEWFVTRQDAEDALVRVLQDEPDFEGIVGAEANGAGNHSQLENR